MCHNLVCPQFTYALDGSPLQVVYLPMQPLHREISSIKLPNPLQTSPISHSIFSINLFLPYTDARTFLEMTSLSGQRYSLRPPMFTVKKATHTFTSCDKVYHTLI